MLLKNFVLAIYLVVVSAAAVSVPQMVSASNASVITIPEKLISNLQQDFNLSKPQAAAIAGNLAHESGNFRMLQEIGGGCYGYSQWCGSRKHAFRAYAAKVGGQTTFDANYGYLKKELKNEYGSMLKRIRATNNVDEVSRIFMVKFLRPAAKTANLKRRISFAKKYLQNDFNGAGCFSHPRMESSNKPAACPNT